MKYLLWAGIDGREMTCDGPEARAACDRMYDGYSVASNGFPLATVRNAEALHYGIVLREFDGPPKVDFSPETTAFPIRLAKVALEKLGITGPVTMHLEPAEVRQAVH